MSLAKQKWKKCVLSISFYEETLEVLTYVYDLKVFNDLYRMRSGQVQGHLKNKMPVCVMVCTNENYLKLCVRPHKKYFSRFSSPPTSLKMTCPDFVFGKKKCVELSGKKLMLGIPKFYIYM